MGGGSFWFPTPPPHAHCCFAPGGEGRGVLEGLKPGSPPAHPLESHTQLALGSSVCAPLPPRPRCGRGDRQHHGQRRVPAGPPEPQLECARRLAKSLARRAPELGARLRSTARAHRSQSLGRLTCPVSFVPVTPGWLSSGSGAPEGVRSGSEGKLLHPRSGELAPTGPPPRFTLRASKTPRKESPEEKGWEGSPIAGALVRGLLHPPYAWDFGSHFPLGRTQGRVQGDLQGADRCGVT